MFFKDEYEFLSNFYPSPFIWDGVIYPTVEHFYQSMKTLDPWEKEKIRLLETPGKAKRAGRKIELRSNWEDLKVTIMTMGVHLKFYSTPELLRELVLVEEPIEEWNNWHDNFWGKCVCKSCDGWIQMNILGKILTSIRGAHLVEIK